MLEFQARASTEPSIDPNEALAFVRDNGVEDWFYAHVVHRRTLQDRIKNQNPLKPRESDQYERLQILIDRAETTFQNRDKALRWLKTAKKSLGDQTPLDYAQRETGFLKVLAHLDRIEHGILP